jgi:hypothetical protein
MIACTRCGSWHEDAETAEGKRLSCTEVKQYWAKIRNKHNDRYGHYPRISSDDDGTWICLRCERKL